MKLSLLPHQEQTIKRLEVTGGRQLLNLWPGAGKTLTTLCYLFKQQLPRVLVVAPASVCAVWEAESEKWCFPEFIRYTGTPLKRSRLLDTLRENPSWTVVSYETYLRDHKNLDRIRWDAVVLDECHKIKSPTAKVSKALRNLCQLVPRAILLSGTPLVNGWGDMWSQVEAVKKGSLYGNWFIFRNMHAIMPIPGVPAITGWRGVEQIKAKIAPHIFTIDKQEIIKHLPPVQEIDIPVELSSKEQKMYASMRDAMVIELEDETLTAANALVKVGRLRQLTDGLFTLGIEESAKLEALSDLLDTLQGQHVIVFSMYEQTVQFMAGKLGIKNVITGSTSGRDEIIARWRKDGGVIMGTSAMSTGLNLQEAAYVIQIEKPWTKAEEDQRIARAWRTGQKRPVTVYNLLARDTIDYGVKKLLERKGGMAEDLAALTMKDIQELLKE